MSSVSYNLLLNKHFTDREMYVHVHACSVAQSCLTLWDPMNYSPPGSSVYGISQARYWRIPMDEEPGGLQPMGSQKVRHDMGSQRVLS